MALLDDMFKGMSGSGLVAGAATLLLAPVVLPVIGRAIRPVAKTVLKTGIVLYRDISHQVGGAMSELVDEAQAELAGAGAAASAGAGAAAGASHSSAAPAEAQHGEPQRRQKPRGPGH